MKVQRLAERRRVYTRNGEINMTKISDISEFIILLDKGYTNEQLAKYYSCGVTTVKRFKNQHGLVGYKTNSRPLSVKEIQCINSLCDKGLSLQQICEQLGKSDYILKKYLPDELYTRIIFNSRQVFAANLIKADITPIFNPTTESAYICGLLQSDGCLSSSGYISFLSKDEDLALKVATFFKTGIRVDREKYYLCKFKDIRNLEKFKKITNILPNKTYSSYNIPDWIKNSDEHMFNFIAGVFDGDGWVHIVKDKKDTIELGISQHILSSNFLREINKYLGWNEYDYSKYSPSRQMFRIATKSKIKTREFYNWYKTIEFIMSRKLSVFESIYL